MSRTTERIQFQGSNDNMLSGVLDEPAEGAIGYLIFSHCFTCTKDLKAIVRLGRELVALRWGVLRYDFAGLGNSQGTFSNSNFSTNRVDLMSAWNWLHRRQQAPTFLIGHSFGGAASLSIADELGAAGVITIAAPSDTRHLAELIHRMNPGIESHGSGEVVIGNREYQITKQMIDNFRAHDFQKILSDLQTPVLAFHSPVDETLSFDHAIRICGYDSKFAIRRDRTLISLPGSNHLLTNQPHDCEYVAQLVDLWCKRHL